MASLRLAAREGTPAHTPQASDPAVLIQLGIATTEGRQV